MKIYGIGVDIVNIDRIKKVLKKASFKKRIFSKEEIKNCQVKKNISNCFAKKFAAKEAFTKALGTGISKGIQFNEIIILNKPSGKPYIKLKNKSLKVVKKIIKKKFEVHISISDEEKYAIANVIITK